MILSRACLRGAAAICLTAAMPLAALAECQSAGDVKRTEAAAVALLEARAALEAVEAEDRLTRGLDLLNTLYPTPVAETPPDGVHAYIATRRTMMDLRRIAGVAAAQVYAAEPAYGAPYLALTGPGGDPDCGAGGSDARSLAAAARAATGGDGGLGGALDRLSRLTGIVVGGAAPDLRQALAIIALMGVVIWAATRRRGAARYACFHPTTLQRRDLPPAAVLVLNISRTGAKIRAPESVVSGAQVALNLDDDWVPARVIWRREGSCGLAFERRITRRRFAAFLRDAENGAGAAPVEVEPTTPPREPFGAPS